MSSPRRPRCAYCGGWNGYCEPLGDGCNEQGFPMPARESHPLIRKSEYDKLEERLNAVTKQVEEIVTKYSHVDYAYINGWKDANRDVHQILSQLKRVLT